MTEELFDIYDDQMTLLGQATRSRVHREGLWHQTFHCWVVTPPDASGRRRLLFQLRSLDKDTYPGLLDTSCAGHLAAGETVQDGVRELAEELGVEVSYGSLRYCGWTAEENYPDGGLIDREYNHIHVLESDRKLEAYAFQREELDGLYWVELQAFRELTEGKRTVVEAVGVRVPESKLPDARTVADQRNVGLDGFTPNSDTYYRALFGALEDQ